MTTITFLGGPETGNVAYCDWGRFRFTIYQPVECDDPHIIAKAASNRFFKVGGGGGQVTAETVPDDPADDPLASHVVLRELTEAQAAVDMIGRGHPLPNGVADRLARPKRGRPPIKSKAEPNPPVKPGGVPIFPVDPEPDTLDNRLERDHPK